MGDGDDRDNANDDANDASGFFVERYLARFQVAARKAAPPPPPTRSRADDRDGGDAADAGGDAAGAAGGGCTTFVDATPNYLPLRHVARRLARAMPPSALRVARFVVIVRDPVDRLLSWCASSRRRALPSRPPARCVLTVCYP